MFIYPSHNSTPVYLRAAIVVLVCGHLSSAGCGRRSVTPRHPDQMLTQATEELRLARTAAASIATRGTIGAKLFHGHMNDGLQLTAALLQHAEASEDQKTSAYEITADLLMLGAKMGEPQWAERLDSLADSLRSKGGPGEAVVSAKQIEWRYISQESAFEEAVGAVEDFAKSHSDSGAAISLFQSLAEQLANRGEYAQALECCQKGVSHYPDAAELKELHTSLEEKCHLQQTQDQANGEFRASVLKRLGGRTGDIFVIMAAVNNVPYIDFKFRVAVGADEAVRCVAKFPAGTAWEVIRQFPHSKKNYNHAVALNDRLAGNYESIERTNVEHILLCIRSLAREF